MKRALSVLLLVFIFIPIISSAFCVSAQESDDTQEDTSTVEADKQQEVKQNVLYFSCTYDSENKTVNVSGTMKHDAFAQYNNSTLEIFLIPPGKTELDVITDPTAKPLAQTSASIKFGFNFKISKLIDRYSRYAIFLKSPEGERILATEAQYADVSSTFEPTKDKNAFKGVSGSAASSAAYVDSDTAVIPIYMDMLFTDTSHGYVYQGENKQLFFSQTYIDDIDKKVNSASISGSGIYLQLLLKKGSALSRVTETEATYLMPDIYDENVLVKIHSAIDFLSNRYALSDSVNTFGFVVGKGWDNPDKYNAAGQIAFDRYVELCGFYTTVVSNAARSVNSSIDIVLPFSGEGFKNDYDTETEQFSVKPLLTALLGYFEESFSSGMSLSVLMQTAEVPLNINNENISSGVNLEYEKENSDFVAGHQYAFSEFMKELDLNYSGSLAQYMFVWTPPATLKGNALAAAYVYSYYTLLGDGAVSSFCVHFDDEAQNTLNFEDINHIVKYIDTSKGVLVTNNLIPYFGKLSWAEIIGAPINTEKTVKSLYSISPSFELPVGIKGSFSYFDFSRSTILDGWYNGSGCGKIKIEYSKNEKKALKAELAMAEGSVSELIYKYDYRENMQYTPYLEFAVGINDDAQDSLYEISIVIENAEARYESACVVSGNTTQNIILDISGVKSFGAVRNIKIFVSPLYGNDGKCSLWLYGINGHSTAYDSAELESLIYEAREKTNDSVAQESQQISWKNIIIAAGLVVITAIFCTAIVLGFRRSGKSNNQ